MKRKMPKFVRFIETPAPEAGSDGDEPKNDAAPEGAETKPDNTEEDADEEDGPEPFDSERALAKIRKANAEAKSQRERAKAAEAKAAGAEDLEKRASGAEARALRLEVALDLGLPKALATRLQGDTAEELAADAEQLLALFQTKQVPTDRPKPALRGGTTPDEEPELDAKAIVDAALGH